MTITSTALFPNKADAIAKMQRDGLMMAAQNLLSGITLDPDYIWGKLIAAESEMSHTLNVKFQPTYFFPTTPTQEQIDALNGMPWEEDPAYDYDPEMFAGEKWGMILVRNKPLISVVKLVYAYPSANHFNFEIPADWLKLDKKYGQVRVVPTTISAPVMLGGFMMNLISAGRSVPHIMNLEYVAGLTNVADRYPELVDATKKLAVLKLIEDTFPVGSGSISADGLSESMSVDMQKYHDIIDRVVNGAGGNGGLMRQFHGIRLGVV